MIVLPKEKVKAKVENPRFLILFGKPKAGKTTLVAALEYNLIIDLEGGSEFLEALAVQARSVNDLGDIANAIREEIKATGNKPYKYITIDNATRLEEMCMSFAIQLYKATPMGKKYEGTDLRTLPNGSGYLYIRQAVRKVIDMFRGLCDNFILIGHTKDKTNCPYSQKWLLENLLNCWKILYIMNIFTLLTLFIYMNNLYKTISSYGKI